MIGGWFRQQEALNLPQLWKAIAELPIDGDKQINPAKVGAVKPLKATRVPSLLDRFRKAAQR